MRDAYGWEVPPTRIFPVADVLAGIAGALDVFSPPGCRVVVPTPAYPPFFEIIELGGREVVEVPMTVDGDRDPRSISTRSMPRSPRGARRCCCAARTTRPGVSSTTRELAALAEIVDRHGARVVADEVHAPLVYAGSRHVPYATVSARRGRAHRDGDVGLEGLEPRRSQVRAGRDDEPC